MRIGKLLNAIGKVDQIAEGIKNKIFKKEDVEQVAALRWKACLQCPALDRVGAKCAMPGTQPCCSDCGCSLGLKLRALSSSCPQGKWPAVMSGEQEKDLKKSINPHLLNEEEQKEIDEKRKEQEKKTVKELKEKKKCKTCGSKHTEKKMKEKYGENYKEKLKQQGIHMNVKTTKPKEDE